MSLYKEKKVDFKNLKKPIIVAVIFFIIIILLVLLIKSDVFNVEEEPINIGFKNDPLHLEKNENTEIEITLKNLTDFDQKNVVVSIIPVEEVFSVRCINDGNKVEIPILSKNTSRKIYCSIIPVVERNNILEGTYSFDVIYQRDEINKDSQRAVLEVRK
jgi:hypothetical protein